MRTLVACLAGLLGVAVILATAVFAAVERTLPSHHAELTLQELHADVRVGFDHLGIPHIQASDDLDAAEALGFVQARDRMMQMDLMRRAAAGELSALIGPIGVRLDETARVLGTREAATASLAALPPRTRALLASYSRGVNAFIALRGRFAAPEYLFLGRPRDWAPVDCMLWAETMGLALSGNLDLELQRLALATRLPSETILSLWPTPKPAPADQASLRLSPGIGDLALATSRALPHFPDPFTLPDNASNEWAVDGSRSATGSPLLAGDPHLSYGLPCLWYLARIETPTGTLAGATAPGTPFVVLGHNRAIAWTFTTTGADTEDLFIEHTTDAAHYAGPSGPIAFTYRRERIEVRGRPDIVIDVRATRHGPVISDLPGLFGIKIRASHEVIAAEIASLAPDNMAADGLYRLEGSGSVAAAGRAAAMLTAPVQNLLVADRQRIALFTTGRVPIRRSGDGAMPSDGADGAHDWTGYASGEALPNVVSPATGILVNANEPVTGTSSSISMGRDVFGDWRARRIRELLDRPGHRFDVMDFTAMQGDVTSAYMRHLLPVLLTAGSDIALAATALHLLERWDGTMSAGSPQPLIAETWLLVIRGAIEKTLGDDGGAAMAPLTFVAEALDGRGPGCGGSCVPMLTRTLAATVRDLAARYGPDPASWSWGTSHRAVFANPFWTAIPILRTVARAAPVVGGDASTVDAQGVAAIEPPLTSVHGASFRGVYDLADLDRSRFVIATGQSGNPFSRHLLDFVDLWQRAKTVAIGEPVDGDDRLVLRAGGH